MKRVLFLLSHFCSGSDPLYHSLNQHPKIQGFRENIIYENRQSLITLTSRDHKLDNESAIYMDELLTNNTIADKKIYSECRYIFILRDPYDTLNEIVATKKYEPRRALNHYLFRLRRMYSIAMKAPDSILLTFADIESGKGSDMIMNYLKLKDTVVIPSVRSMELDNLIPLSFQEEASAAFEHWLYRLKKLGLLCPSS